MNAIGIIAEYNPFHNGHIYHINKIKEMYPDSIIIACISTSFCERGEISILNKWDKTNICLNNNIDLVVELPFVYSSQSADIFAKGALKILNDLKINKLIFGSESNNINNLIEIAKIQINNKDFDLKVKNYLDKGFNYPTALSNSLKDFKLSKIDKPNDLLGISYIKEIIKNNYNIEPISIKRTNDYHELITKSNIISANAIRNLIKENKDIKKYVPMDVSNLIYKNIDIFPFLKYKINSDKNILSIYQTVDEGIENRLIKYVNESDNLEDFIEKVKTKRFTYNRINRMLIHILTSFTKEESKLDLSYIRILGFNKNGNKYLNSIKKEVKLPLITGYVDDRILNIEYRITNIYSILINDKSLIKKELKKPIIK